MSLPGLALGPTIPQAHVRRRPRLRRGRLPHGPGELPHRHRLRMDDYIFQEFKGTGNMELVLDRKLADRRVYPPWTSANPVLARRTPSWDRDSQEGDPAAPHLDRSDAGRRHGNTGAEAGAVPVERGVSGTHLGGSR